MAPSHDPKDYWLERGKVLHKEGHSDASERRRLQEEFIVKELKPLSFSSVLEVGCGSGGITKLLLDNFSSIGSYDAVDLSPDQIARAREYVDNPKVSFAVSSIQSFESSKKYDLVMASGVLHHIKPEEIQSLVGKLLSLSAGFFVHVDFDDENPRPQAHNAHDFMHDYDAIYRRLGFQYAKTGIRAKKGLETIDTGQSIFVVSNIARLT